MLTAAETTDGSTKIMKMPVTETRVPRLIVNGLLLSIAFLMTGCGGNKVLKESKPLELEGPLAVESDANLAVAFDWVIVRDGPGTWSKNADWDEYLFRIHNRGANAVTIESVVIYDSLETLIQSNSDRKQLIKGSRNATKRYKAEGLEVKAGLGGAGLVAAGGAAYVAGMGLGAAALGATGSAASAGVVAVGAIVAAPVLVAGGILRGANNGKVAAEIEKRHSMLPLTLATDGEAALDVFFPISPSPVRIEIKYSESGKSHLLTIDTAETLDGLHLRAPVQEN